MKFGIVAMTMFSAHKLDDSEKRGFTLQRIGKGGNGKKAVVVLSIARAKGDNGGSE
jgi:hypothetical protein